MTGEDYRRLLTAALTEHSKQVERAGRELARVIDTLNGQFLACNGYEAVTSPPPEETGDA